MCITLCSKKCAIPIAKHSFLDTIAMLQKVTTNFTMSVHLSVHLHITIILPLDNVCEILYW